MGNVLHIPLKGIYFDEIVAGTKSLEYRIANEYWKKRLEGRQYDYIELSRGYPKRDDMTRRHRVHWRGYTMTMLQHEHFGDEELEVYAIDVSESITYTPNELAGRQQ